MSYLAHLPTDSVYRQETVSAIPAKPPGVITFPIASFDEAYPPDPFGEEASEHARVWKVYRDQATEHDKKQLDGWNKTLDILLIFAGLYSAVLTAFLIESYHMLTEDSTDYMAKLLFQVVSANNGSLSLPILQPVAGPIQPPGANFTLTSTALWVNGLWFSSLALTLSVALLCILAKEWLTEYEGVVFARAPTAHYWTRRRVLHHKGLKKWGVPFLISSLPSLLHVALFLFIVGLDLFLLPLDHGIAIAVGAIGGIVLVFYLLHFIIPIWNTSCAFRSPLARHIRRASGELWYRVVVAGTTFKTWHDELQHSDTPQKVTLSDVFNAAYRVLLAVKGPHPSIPSREQRTVDARSAQLDAHALHWLLSSSTRSVASAAMQAIGSIRPVSNIAKQLHDLGVQATIDGYMATRTQELTDANIIHNEAALSEHIHCVRAMLCSAGGSPIKGETPFTEVQPSLQHVDAKLLNRFVHILRSAAPPPSIGTDVDSKLLHALEDLSSEQPGFSVGTQPHCHPSTFFMLFDVLQLRLAHGHGIQGVLEAEFQPIGRTITERRTKSRAVAIHCAMVVHLVHALSPSNVLDNDAAIIALYLSRCSEALASITRLPFFPYPGLSLFPGNHFDTKPRYILFTTWICLAAHSRDLLFSADTERTLARDIALMAPTFASAFVEHGHLADTPASSEPYWSYVNSAVALTLPWSASDLDSLVSLIRPRHIYYNIEEPRTRRAIVMLINHSAILPPGSFNPNGIFAGLFRSEGVPSFSLRDFNDNIDDIIYFVISYNTRPSAWATLHGVICANGNVNTYVVQLAIALAAALRTRLLDGTSDNIRYQIREFFRAPFLGPCLSRLCSDYLELESDLETSQDSLEGRLQVAGGFLADCAFISPYDTAEQIRNWINDSNERGAETATTPPSARLATYLERLKKCHPREQHTTMRLFSNTPEFSSTTRLSQLTASLGPGTGVVPRAALEASLVWDFWSAADLVQHRDILATTRVLIRHILAIQHGNIVTVPVALLSVISELLAQEAALPFDLGDGDELRSQATATDFMSELGAHRMFTCQEFQGPLNAAISAVLLDMQRLSDI